MRREELAMLFSLFGQMPGRREMTEEDIREYVKIRNKTSALSSNERKRLVKMVENRLDKEDLDEIIEAIGNAKS